MIRDYIDYKDFKRSDLFSCQRPKRVFQRSTNSFIVVPCGHCSACLTRLSRKASMLCDIQESFHKYCMFVTLTYRNENIPLMRFEKRVLDDSCVLTSEHFDFDFASSSSTEPIEITDFYDVTERFSKRDGFFGKYLFSGHFSDGFLSLLSRKFRYFGNDFPYLSKYDAQCFIKRFRKHLSKITDEKVSYYIVGEYGPVHFRPHFHVLFFFDSQKIFENFRQILFKSWKLGNCDFSLSRKKCSSYVASYVNQRSSIPRLYQLSPFVPFALHSQKFATRLFESKKEKIYENEPSYFVQYLCSEVIGKQNITPWRSLVSMFFPKCRDYVSKDFNQLLYSYTLLSKAKRFYKDVVFDDNSVTNLSYAILNDIISNYHYLRRFLSDIRDTPFDKVFSISSKDYFLIWICRYSLSLDKLFVNPCYMDSVETDSLLNAIQSDLRVSRHFLNFVCDNNSYSEIHLKLHKIVDYYDYVSYRNLCLQLSHQEQLNLTPFDSNLYDLFYDNVYVDFDNLQDYDGFYDFLTKSNLAYHDAVKHKIQNDQNHIFTDYRI